MGSTCRALGVLAATLITLGISAGAALASTNDVTSVTAPAAVSGTSEQPAAQSQCDDFNICIWTNSGFAGTFWEKSFFAEPTGPPEPVGSSVNNAGSALENNRDGATVVTQFAGGTGHAACLPPHFSISNLAGINWPNTGTTMNDSITSYAFTTWASCPPGSVP